MTEGTKPGQSAAQEGEHHFDVPPVDASRPVVLVIDDSPMIRYLVAEVLQPMGAQVVEAEDGTVGLTLARHYRPNAILLDIHLEEEDGLETLSAIRKDPQIESTPVIMLTVDASKAMIQQAMQWKISGYLVKPVLPHKLREAVRPFITEQ